jgi:hypothetical protein
MLLIHFQLVYLTITNGLLNTPEDYQSLLFSILKLNKSSSQPNSQEYMSSDSFEIRFYSFDALPYSNRLQHIVN